MDQPAAKLAHNVTRLGHYALPGAGQVYVDGHYCYVGHITNKDGLATSILDIADPKNPKVVSQIPVGDPHSHSHKARVAGDIMITNMEQNMTAIGRKADELPKLRTLLRSELGRDPTHAELAARLGVNEADIPPKDVHVVFNKHTGAHYNAWPHEKVCPASLPDTDHVGACDICKWCFT